MSREHARESATAPAQEALRHEDRPTRTTQFHVGDPIPYVLTKDELANFTGYSLRQIDRFRAAHTHPGIKQLEGPGHPRFCGRALRTWLDGDTRQPVARRFFASSRRSD